jgi:hypothetical protein
MALNTPLNLHLKNSILPTAMVLMRPCNANMTDLLDHFNAVLGQLNTCLVQGCLTRAAYQATPRMSTHKYNAHLRTHKKCTNLTRTRFKNLSQTFASTYLLHTKYDQCKSAVLISAFIFRIYGILALYKCSVSQHRQ